MTSDPLQTDCSCGPDPVSTPDAQSALSPSGPGGQAIRVLLIDDDSDDYFLTKDLLSEIQGDHFTLDWTASYDEGLEALCNGTHQIYLLDYRLGAQTGIDLLRAAHTRGCSGPVILLTGQGQSRTDLEALDAGANDYLEKDRLTSAVLERSIRFALAQHAAEVELEQKVKDRTEELGRLNEALREADRRKDEFLATLAHELRNPLVPICNALEILRLVDHTNDTIARQRERLERQVAQLVRLVDDLLDVSRITTGKLHLNLEKLTLQEIIESALEMTEPQFARAKVKFSKDLSSEVIYLQGDRVRLTQVFTNILNNAAKFSEVDGRIFLTVQSSDSTVTVNIRDTGIGIPEEILPNVFSLFTQSDRSISRSQGGLGIGLALVRRLVEMHQGTVAAHSNGPGTGATFSVTLPIIDKK